MKVDLVVKVGGSLDRGKSLQPLMEAIQRLSRRWKILVVPGGGRFADGVRDACRRYHLSDTAAHWMAIVAMDQYGYLLAGLSNGGQLTRSIKEVNEVLRSGGLPILLPSRLLLRWDPLAHSWNVTSDSIAAYLAERVRAKALVLLKDVDGIFTHDPRSDPQAGLLPAVRLVHVGRYGCLDRAFSRTLGKDRSCWIVNGRHPERLEELLLKGKTLGTAILP